MNNSELLSGIRKKNALNSEHTSEHTTLNEEVQEEPENQEAAEKPKTTNVEEDLADWYRKTFDKPASSKTQKNWEDALEDGTLDAKTRAKFIKKFAQQRAWEKNHPDQVNHEPDLKPVTKHEVEEPVPEEVLTEKAKTSANADKILDNLWNEEQPTEAETRNALKRLVSKTTVENFEDLEDFDEESFDSHITEYLTEVYSNVKSFKTIDCALEENKLVVEGKITFNSGKEKNTKFIFEAKKENNKIILEGLNADFATEKAFVLNCNLDTANRLVVESLSYKYTINNTLVEGLTK